jgi:hypothetical protein
MEKLSASFLASVASILMYLVLRRGCGRWSLPLALVFAFGTNTWMISSQALWQHASGELLIALALLLIVFPASAMHLALLGGVCCSHGIKSSTGLTDCRRNRSLHDLEP